MTSRCQGLFPPHPFLEGKALGTRLNNVTLVSPVFMSKKVEVKVPILCQYMQLKITYPRATVRLFYPFPHLLVLLSEVVLSLFGTYI